MEKILCWFRNDLRISDNPALLNASEDGEVLPIYIFDNFNANEYHMGSVSKWWLHQSLTSLKKSLDGNLMFYKGNPLDILLRIIKDNSINSVYWNRCYEPWQIARDKIIKKTLQENGIKVKTYNASLLWEPWDILKQDNTPYKVFTPYYRKGCMNYTVPRNPIPKPKNICYTKNNDATSIYDLDLLPKINWYSKLNNHWEVGEEGALRRFETFYTYGIKNYKEGRNFPIKQNVSRLSPHLHFGEISPNYIWHKIRSIENAVNMNDIDHFCSELGWREFSYYLLYHFPDLPKINFNHKFDIFPWNHNLSLLKCWQQGQTGLPIVDAGMRELWQTGYMHNRVRMIVGSFLVKNLRIHWHYGQKWFWDCLADADLANNSASWQWIAGCGADAAPYFRIFNPITQGQKFDPDGEYTKKFVPELKNVPSKYLFNPWEAPENVLKSYGVTLGKDYPMPIIDLKESRNNALDAFHHIKISDKYS
jgi:deoxyribodipyrimidine photo-lyase